MTHDQKTLLAIEDLILAMRLTEIHSDEEIKQEKTINNEASQHINSLVAALKE